MSYFAITLGAAAIGISCIATDVLARGGGGAGGGSGGKGGGAAVTTGFGGPTVKGAGKNVRVMHRTTGVRGPDYTTGVAGPTESGGAAARYYAPALYDSNTACGRYPYPPCKNAP